MTSTFEHDLDGVRINKHAKYMAMVTGHLVKRYCPETPTHTY